MTKEHLHTTPTERATELSSVFFKLFWPAVALAGITLLASGSFPYAVRQEIKERDNWSCRKCGCDWRPYLHASHDNHSRNHPLYKKAAGGKTLCVACHYDYHFDNHQHSLAVLGLTMAQNLYALEELWKSMDEADKKDRKNRDYRAMQNQTRTYSTLK